MTTVTIPNGFTPRPYQRAAMRYFDRGGNRAITVWHRRGGKDLTALHQTCKAMHRRRGVYWHVFPTGEQGKKAIWEGFTKDGERMMEQIFPASIRKSPRYFAPNGEMVVELKCGSIWRLLGSDKMEVVGAGPVGVVFSEYALAKPTTWDLIRPMLRENGGWAWMITTPRGKNHAHKLYTMAKQDASWFCDLKTLYDTRAYDPDQTIAEERASGMPEELINQEYLCDWTAALVGSFYGASLTQLETEGRLLEYTAARPGAVFTSWDLGKTDDTAVWWWCLNDAGGVDILDHYASHGEEPSHYFHVVEERAELQGWRYAKHILPHDARAQTFATRTTVQEQFHERFGSGSVVVLPALSVKDGIAAARKVLSNKGTRLHTRCSLVAHSKDCDGVEALRAYRREWDDEHKCFSEKPVHDWASHTADAFREMAMAPVVADVLTRKHEPPPKKKPEVEVTAAHVVIDDAALFRRGTSRGGGGRI